MAFRPESTGPYGVTAQDGSITNVLPISSDIARQPKLVSDSTVLRVSTALQASLHVKDVIHAFANEVRRLVRDTSLRYRHRPRQLIVEDGTGQLHRCSYELSLLGDTLGELAFTRAERFQ